MNVVRPNEKTLERLLEKGTESIILVSPFISPAGLKEILRILNSRPSHLKELEMWIRLSAQDHENGLTDYQILLDFLKHVKNNLKVTVKVRYSEKLHAKIYMTQCQALVTSSNLTSNGFGNNFEAGILLDSVEEMAQLRKFIINNRGAFKNISLAKLEKFCKDLPKFASKPFVSEVARDPIDITGIFKDPPHYNLPGLR
ncbi:MAG: phospholipase D-like domain-containing protein [Candidatus Bathyarchaeia archaeon]|jgi:HKD family nuclease